MQRYWLLIFILRFEDVFVKAMGLRIMQTVSPDYY